MSTSYDTFFKYIDEYLTNKGWDVGRASNSLMVKEKHVWFPPDGDPFNDKILLYSDSYGYNPKIDITLKLQKDKSIYTLIIQSLDDFHLFVQLGGLDLKCDVQVDVPIEGIDLGTGKQFISMEGIYSLIDQIFDK